ncbi:MAG: cobyrinate a,c-diamide synthase [Muribaculum sp.]|nr:cobyrinate a,c-diamide synthase [Muribaculum sp.]
MAKSGFIIAATSSGCGKTTLSLGLMRELTRRGICVQPFKCGPDYIDTQFHRAATGTPSINLDTFMSSDIHVKDLFQRYSFGKDVAIVEGVMGMFDGYSRMRGSSAELSRLLSVPVILLINAASTAYSVAATIYGFKNFQPDINIAGVIFNRVSSESHYSFLKDACKDAGVECLGYIKKDNSLSTPSRHLGLTLTAKEEMNKFINSAADAVAEHVDIEKLLKLTELQSLEFENPTTVTITPNKVAAVACDEAFNFIYPANLDRLHQLGYEIVQFSPIHDKWLPKADFVYLPGGYPELFEEEIAANDSMKNSVREYVERGGRLWAECGGMIYLSQEIDGFPMCGVLPIKCTMQDAKLSLGYRTICFGDKVLKGHEFHYSHVVNPDCMESVATQKNAKGTLVKTPVYRYKNAFASYTHLYWADPIGEDC